MRPDRVAVAAMAVLLGAAAPKPAPTPSADWAGSVATGSARRTAAGPKRGGANPRGGLMLGFGRSGKADRVLGFEFSRIALDADGKVVFWGSPAGSRAAPFLVEESAPRRHLRQPAA